MPLPVVRTFSYGWVAVRLPAGSLVLGREVGGAAESNCYANRSQAERAMVRFLNDFPLVPPDWVWVRPTGRPFYVFLDKARDWEHLQVEEVREW